MPTRTGPDVEAHVLAVGGQHRRGPDWLGAELGVPARTVSRILRRHGVPRLAVCDPMTGEVIRASKTTAVRYERERPGELVHMDVAKKIGRIPDGGGWRARGHEMGHTWAFVMKTLSGLMSRWMMSRACAAASTSATACADERHLLRRAASRRGARRAPPRSRLRAAPSRGTPSRPRPRRRRGRAPRPGARWCSRRSPSRAKRLRTGVVHRELRVQHLDGDAAPVAVRRRVDRRHPADARGARRCATCPSASSRCAPGRGRRRTGGGCSWVRCAPPIVNRLSGPRRSRADTAPAGAAGVFSGCAVAAARQLLDEHGLPLQLCARVAPIRCFSARSCVSAWRSAEISSRAVELSRRCLGRR